MADIIYRISPKQGYLTNNIRLHDYFGRGTVDNLTTFVFQGLFKNGLKYGSQGLF